MSLIDITAGPYRWVRHPMYVAALLMFLATCLILGSLWSFVVAALLAALFVAQATNTHLSLSQQMTIFSVAVLTSKGASGVQGASFIALVGTLSVIPAIPVAGMALILGIDRFMSMFRAMINMLGNGVATLVVARWEHELDPESLRKALSRPSEIPVAVGA